MGRVCQPRQPSGEQLRRDMWRDRFDLLLGDALLADMTKREALILRMRYGLYDKKCYCYSADEIATLFSIQRRKAVDVAHIQHTEKRAIRRLQQPDRVAKAKCLGLHTKYGQLTMPGGMALLARLIAGA